MVARGQGEEIEEATLGLVGVVLVSLSLSFLDMEGKVCVVDVRGKEKTLENMSIVNEFVFPDDLPGIPHSRAIDFVIEIEPETGSISKAP